MRREDILIVNDGTPFLKTIGRILEDRGHRTCVTDSPDDGLTELARKYFRLVIVKVNGRDADYLGLLRGVKDLNPEARLIILGVEGRLPVEAFKLEADDYILLPVEYEFSRLTKKSLVTLALIVQFIRHYPLSENIRIAREGPILVRFRHSTGSDGPEACAGKDGGPDGWWATVGRNLKSFVRRDR